MWSDGISIKTLKAVKDSPTAVARATAIDSLIYKNAKRHTAPEKKKTQRRLPRRQSPPCSSITAPVLLPSTKHGIK